MTPSSITTASTRNLKRDAADQPADRASKQQRQITRPLRSNAALRAELEVEQTRIRAEKELAATPVALERTSSNQDQSPFLRLPAELRTRIYELALGGNVVEPHMIRNKHLTGMPGRVARYSANEVAMYTFRGVILTCRAFHAETELVLYSANSFFVRFRGNLPVWLRMLDEKKRAAIRSVHWQSYDVSLRHARRLPRLYDAASFFPPLSKMSSLLGASKLMSIIVHVKTDLPSSIKKAVESYAQSAEWQVTIEYEVADFYSRIYGRSITEIEAALLGTT